MRSIGKLRHRLTLQYKSETRTSNGDVVTAWVTDTTVWGAIEPLTGREYVGSGKTQNENTVRIVMRYHSTINATWRVLNDSRAFSILDVMNDNERDRMTVIMCSQGVFEEEDISDDALYVVSGGVYVVNGGVQVINT